ncbi:hypothetical protein JJV70_10545 [Streptomyces sp. JJ66]|uniref:alpha/beta hydrolase n=1 Tax=Streptomyces sp. JJ66 TaxID=2803843 RepID=UPI001C55CEF9|nr:alpha/beta hydrolase [Streptomyces sp. JJ66]MBW1602538.1 hypothetical protein [Streptomyces sp. JJ66]
MVTYAQLRSLKPEDFEQDADDWHKVSSAAGDAMDRLKDDIAAKMRESLKGEACDAALSRLMRLGENFQYTQSECGLIRTALNDLARDLRAAKKKLNDAVEDAVSAGFTVAADGSVQWVAEDVPVPLLPEQSVSPGSPRPPLLSGSPGIDPKQAEAEEYAARIGQALSEATTADQTWSPVLLRLKAKNTLEITEADWMDASDDMEAVREAVGSDVNVKDIPDGISVQENAEWWKSLSQDERDDYVALYPASIGGLDGIPAVVRDDANRFLLQETQGRTTLELEAHLAREPDRSRVRQSTWERWDAEREALEKKLKGMSDIEKRFSRTGKDGLPEAYLLGFDPKDDGKVIIATGNPDTAEHTAVYVPGTGAELGRVNGEMRREANLWRESDAAADGPVSTITWIGYDAPDDPGYDAPFPNYAERGAPDFNRFLRGLDATHEPDVSSHKTVVAHSYGSTLVGLASQVGEFSADDVVFAGSPGVRVGRAEDLSVPEGHVWNQEAEWDLVPDIGRYSHGHHEFRWWGMAHVVPSDDEFGAQQMTTDTTGHSDYWEKGTQSLRNQAAVVAGDYTEVELEK